MSMKFPMAYSFFSLILDFLIRAVHLELNGMIFRKIFVTAISIITLVVAVEAQNGAPLLSHFRESREIENQSWAICQDDNNIMLFANRRGILTFDGHLWDFIRIPAVPYSLKYNLSDDRVYVGGQDNYGYLVRDEKGFYNYTSLSGDTSDLGMITRIIISDSTIYFYGDKSISRHNIKTGELQLRLGQKGGNPFTGMFVTRRNTFVNVYSKGLYRLDSDTLFPIVTGYLLVDREVLFSLPYDENRILLGLSDGALELFDGIKFYEFPVEDEGYLRQNMLSEGLMISDSLYAFSTLDGGAIVVDKNSGKLLHAINYVNGLPDDEIFAMGTDKNNGLWLSHQYGLTRVELILPVSNFTIYGGLRGNLSSSLWHDGELYVSTSEGIFYLSEIRNYGTVEILVRNEAARQQAAQPAPEPAEQQKEQEVQEPRRNILSRIFGRRNVREENEAAAAEEELKPETPVLPATVPEYVRRTVSRLKSVTYQYNKVEGIDEKCKQMISTDQGILASTTRGLFLISDHTARMILNNRYINYICGPDNNDRYCVAASDGYFFVIYRDGLWNISNPDYNFSEPLYSVVFQGDHTVWAGTDNGIYRISTGRKPEYRIYRQDNLYPERYNVDLVNDTLFVFSETGISYLDEQTDSLRIYDRISLGTGPVPEFVLSQQSVPWVKSGDEWLCLDATAMISKDDRSLLKIFDEILSVYTDDRNIWIINGKNQIFRISRNIFKPSRNSLDLYIKSISNEEGIFFRLSDIVFGRGDNTVYFEVIAPSYLKENSTQYQYIIDGVMNDWSKWTTSSTISLIMQPGTYKLRVRAKDLWGNITDVRSLEFTIKTPFVRTTLFYLIIGLLILLLIIVIARFRESKLQKDKQVLEEKVRERTAEIAAQKEEITSSIEYASRIQMAMLPVNEHFSQVFREFFIIFMPRDIVSGDFYWIGEDSSHIYFTVADCTGHGVPGAFMSTLGISTLNEIITNRRDLHANTILNMLRDKIKTSLHQTGKEGEAADGMDLAFCMLSRDRKKLEYAGAFNPLLVWQSGQLKEYKADRMPIGIFVQEKESFTNYEIRVKKGDIIYLFTDGFADQFGGPGGAKFKKSNLKKLISEICTLPMDEQKMKISEEFSKWKGNTAQIDDVTVIGIKI